MAESENPKTRTLDARYPASFEGDDSSHPLRTETSSRKEGGKSVRKSIVELISQYERLQRRGPLRDKDRKSLQVIHRRLEEILARFPDWSGNYPTTLSEEGNTPLEERVPINPQDVEKLGIIRALKIVERLLESPQVEESEDEEIEIPAPVVQAATPTAEPELELEHNTLDDIQDITPVPELPPDASVDRLLSREKIKYRKFWFFLEELRSQVGLEPPLGTVAGRDILFDSDPNEDLKRFHRSFVTALLRYIRLKVTDVQSTGPFAVGEINVMGAEGKRIFSLGEVGITGNIDTLLTAMPERLKPLRPLINHRLVAYQIAWNRAVPFKDIYANPQGKKPNVAIDIWNSFGDNTGGLQKYDLTAMYKTDLDQVWSEYQDVSEIAAILGGTEDYTWQVGNLKIFIKSRIRKLVNQERYNYSPVTKNAQALEVLQKRIVREINELGLTVDDVLIDPVEIENTWYSAIADRRSTGEEMDSDKIARDNEVSRLMNSRKWITSADNKNLIRSYQVRPSLANRFERMAVTQEEFVHFTIHLPREALEFVSLRDHLASFEAPERNKKFKELFSKWGGIYKDANFTAEAGVDPVISSINYPNVDVAATIDDLDEQIFIFKIKPEYQVWEGKADLYAGQIIIPREFLFDDPRTPEERKSEYIDGVQIMLTMAQQEDSLVDPNYVDFSSITSGMNKKYANLLGYFSKWFNEFGSYSPDTIDKMFKRIHSFKGLHIEKNAELMRGFNEFVTRTKKNLASARSIVRPTIEQHGGNEAHDTHEHNETQEIIAKLTEFAFEMDERLRSLIYVAPPESSDFKNFGIEDFSHYTVDYLLDELLISGSSVYVRTPTGALRRSEVENLQMLRDTYRGRDGRRIPNALHKVIQGVSASVPIAQDMTLIEVTEDMDEGQVNAFSGAVEELNITKQRMKNDFIISSLLLGIDIYLDQYRYEQGHSIPLPGGYDEIKTIAGDEAPPMNFAHRAKFLALFDSYIHSFVTTPAFAKWGYSYTHEEIMTAIRQIMIDKGIVGSPEQLVVDTRYMDSDAYKNVPTRRGRLLKTIKEDEKEAH